MPHCLRPQFQVPIVFVPRLQSANHRKVSKQTCGITAGGTERQPIGLLSQRNYAEFPLVSWSHGRPETLKQLKRMA